MGLSAFADAAAGRRPLAEALDAAAQDTRRYAKRQLTWFRNQTAEWARIEDETPAAATARLFALADAKG